MKIAVLGASGLIGHKLFEILGKTHDVFGLIHSNRKNYQSTALLQSESVHDDIDVLEYSKLENVLAQIQPNVVLNCVGITKRKKEIQDPAIAIAINSLFPHKLVELSRRQNFRVIHFSTDCVFNGATGDYTELSDTTGEDMYGKTKALGELHNKDSLTIRSSFIGRELAGKTELLEWLLSQQGKSIKGFTEAYYSGVSTAYMARVVQKIIEDYPDLGGLYQLATPEPISKYDLLCAAKDAFNLDVNITPDSSFKIKPTLNGSKLAKELNLRVPAWDVMLAELSTDALYE